MVQKLALYEDGVLDSLQLLSSSSLPGSWPRPLWGPCCCDVLQLDGRPPGPLRHASSCQPQTAEGLFQPGLHKAPAPRGCGMAQRQATPSNDG